MSREEDWVLKFKRHGEYSNTRCHFSVFEFTADCPEIPATRPDADPAHAVIGDEFWIEADEFKLKRAGVTIGNPEYWQVKHILSGSRVNDPGAMPAQMGFLESIQLDFAGKRVTGWKLAVARRYSPSTTLEAGTILLRHEGKYLFKRPGCPPVECESIYLAMLRRHENLVNPERVRQLGRLGRTQAACTVAVVEYDIQTTPVQKGDLLLLTDDIEQVRTRGKVVALKAIHLKLLRHDLQKHQSDIHAWTLFTTITPEGWGWQTAEFPGDFFKHESLWGLGSNVWRPKAFLLKDIPKESVSRPIQARSDAGAIFELLCQVESLVNPRGRFR